MYQPVISIVIPVRNEGDRIIKTINSFAFGRSTLFHLEFVIIDDASDDGCCTSLEDILTWEYNAAVIRVIRLEQWSGIPYARNIGALDARAPILFITDANVEVCNSWDVPVFRDLQPGRVLCATIADTSSSWRGYGCALHLPSMGVGWLINPSLFQGDVPVSPCAGTILHADLFKRVGGYDTAMPVYGAAEPEFSVRLWLYGANIISCPDLILFHRFRPADERKPFLKKIELLQVVNYLRFGLLYLDEKKVPDLLNYWANVSPTFFKEALVQIKSSNISKRSEHLRQNLLYDFDWFIERFKLIRHSNI